MPVAAPQHTGLPAGEGEAAVRRARPIYRVFVSSTWLDLQPERKALMEALNRMEEMRFVGMEFFGNRPDDTHDASIDQVDVCEVFIGIIGHRYGSGITEAEYRRARALGLPCFAYFKREDTARPELTDNDPALAARLATFKQELMRGHTVKEFASPEELAANATADLHNWVAARWITLEREAVAARPPAAPPDADRTNALRLIERIEQDWIKGVLEASLHHRAWLELGLDWREDAVEHPWDRIVVAADRPIQTLGKEDSITGVFDAAQHTLLVLGEPGAGKTTTVLELARDLIARARTSAAEPVPVVLALSTWRGQHKDLTDWLVAELGLRYQVPKRVARTWLEEGRLMLILDGLDEVVAPRRAACVEAINAFEHAHHPPGLAITCRVAEYDALSLKLRLRSAICLQPLTPAQIERYFKAAGASLDPLRLALRDDAGLRELARSPLMLSVMTMAWRDPGQTAAPFASARSTEELRRRLFDAYVQAALKRRGKAAAAYTPEQTIGWLSWLARRMKESGHTLFAVEQLQPGWLGGVGRQFGYFMTTRLLGVIGLALPFLVWDYPARTKAIIAGMGVAVGAIFGVVDFGFARHGWGGEKSAVHRLRAQLTVMAACSVAWMIFAGDATTYRGARSVLFFLLMAGFAFCAPLDVRTLDVKPAARMSWSWRLAFDRGLMVFVGLVMGLSFMVAVIFGIFLGTKGWAYASAGFQGAGQLLAGLTVAAGLIATGWTRLRPPRTVHNVALAITFVLLGGHVGMMFSDSTRGMALTLLAFELIPVVAIGVLGGFTSTMIDPTRGRNAGVWFWLRVPVEAFLVVGLLATIPGFLWLYFNWAMVTSAGPSGKIFEDFGIGAAFGLVAFFRFGGFNGVQHYFLRWLLVRSGDLPPRAEFFFNQTAQLALMQKVGLGYRFIHALLLEHFAGPAAHPGTKP